MRLCRSNKIHSEPPTMMTIRTAVKASANFLTSVFSAAAPALSTTVSAA